MKGKELLERSRATNYRAHMNQKMVSFLKGLLPKKTNADRIREMSDEELQEFLYSKAWCCESYQICSDCPLYHEEKVCLTILEWLQEPVKEN